MATPVKKTDLTTKHWTNEERAKREAAEKAMERKFVRMIAPARVTADPVAHRYWKNTIDRMKGITLLDNVDTDMLASYCLAQATEDFLRAEYDAMRGRSNETIERTIEKVLNFEYTDEAYPAKVIRSLLSNELTQLYALQAQERVVITYQKELGLTPNGRQRLAKKRAEERPITEEDRLYGD